MDEKYFNHIATEELAFIADSLESDDREGLLDIECQDGILSIKLEDGGEYVINKHTPTRKIWASSPLSGASYYAYDETSGHWHTTKGTVQLLRTMLKEELEARLGIDVRW